jgi:hypothetical protein
MAIYSGLCATAQDDAAAANLCTALELRLRKFCVTGRTRS